MTSQRLSRLERVDLRTVWSNTTEEFTPWLACAENLRLLGDALGIDLRLQVQEKDVGPFRADLLCKDAATGELVLIESQLERTDDAQLGRLLTHAAGLEVVTVVWVARRLTEEHRAALDWLNQVADGQFNFFGLEVELWRIGDSPPAPRFSAVCKPNDWGRVVARSIEVEGLTEAQKAYQVYWQTFLSQLQQTGSHLPTRRPKPKHYLRLPLGRPGFRLLALRYGRDARKLWAGVVCSAPDLWPLLERQGVAVNRAFGTPLDWNFQEGRKRNRVGLRLRGADLTDRTDWPRQHEWLQRQLERLQATFGDRVRDLEGDSRLPNGQT